MATEIRCSRRADWISRGFMSARASATQNATASSEYLSMRGSRATVHCGRSQRTSPIRLYVTSARMLARLRPDV